MAHDGHFVEGRLAVEKDQVSVAELAFDGPSDLHVSLATHGALVKPYAILVDDVANAWVLLGDHFAYRIIIKTVDVFDHG